MNSFFVSKNPDLRVPVDAQFVEWLKSLPDTFHALMGVIGPDFRSDCILIKSQGVFNIWLDATEYKLATKEGAWRRGDFSEAVNPISAVEDKTDKIRDFLISVSDRIFPELKSDTDKAKDFAKMLKVLWVVALTYPFLRGNFPTTSGRIYCNQNGFANVVKSWLSSMPWGMSFTAEAVNRLANLLGLEAISASQLTSLRTVSRPLSRNPYHFTGEVLANKFCGRVRELEIAKSCLSQDPSTPVALVGLQRTGKSSLAAEIIRQMQKEEKQLRVISYVLGEFEEDGGCADIAGFLLKSIPDMEAIEPVLDSLHKLKLKKSVGLERELFRDALKHLNRKSARPTLLFLDELHKLNERTAGSGHSTFPDFLENIAKDKSLRLRLLVGARPILMTETESVKRVNLLKLFRPITVASVDEETAIKIINLGQPNLLFDPDAVRRILSLSGRNPYWIQLLCFESFLTFQGKAQTGKVTLKTIDSIFLELLKGGASRSYFESQYLDVVPLGPPMKLLDEVARLAISEGSRVPCGKLLGVTNNNTDNLTRDLRPLLDYEILSKHTDTDPVTVSFISEALRLHLRYDRNLPLGQPFNLSFSHH
jgi:AAA ATPase domain